MTAAAESIQTILFVCTGNICRSPYMEHTLRGMLEDRDAASVAVIRSAGVRALAAHPLAGPLAVRLADRGIDSTSFRATELTAEGIAEADLVVTATREHRGEVVRLAPSAVERTFTLGQLARLLHVTPLEGPFDVQGLVAAAHAAQGRGTAGSDSDDLEDPWRRSRRTYRRVAGRIDALLEPIAARLADGR